MEIRLYRMPDYIWVGVRGICQIRQNDRHFFFCAGQVRLDRMQFVEEGGQIRQNSTQVSNLQLSDDVYEL